MKPCRLLSPILITLFLAACSMTIGDVSENAVTPEVTPDVVAVISETALASADMLPSSAETCTAVMKATSPLFAAPGTAYQQVSTVAGGDTFTVIGRSADGWYNLGYPDVANGAWVEESNVSLFGRCDELAVRAVPTIATFTVTAPSVDRAALSNRTARLPVLWWVQNRPENSNLVFEQILDIDQQHIINVELPRAVSLVASEGNGMVAPIQPDNANQTAIWLRLRLVNLADNSTIAFKDISVPITTGNQPAVTPTSIYQVTKFTIEPINPQRGGTITITWEVKGVQSVSMYLEGTEYRAREFVGTNLLPAGTLTYTLPVNDYFVETATLYLYSQPEGASDLIQFNIQCPFTLMVAEQKCPMREQQVEATYQPFEHGLMVQLNDLAHTLYIMHDDGFILFPGIEGSAPGASPPAELFAPEGNFGDVWNRHGEDPNGPLIRERMGWATAASQSYTAQVQTSPYIRSSEEVYLRLPDNRVVGIHVFFGRPVTWRIL